MPRRKNQGVNPRQTDLLDITTRLKTGVCVFALREAVKAWRAGGYKGITDTTRLLLNHWLQTDHRLSTGPSFKYHHSQQEAIETLVFLWEYEKVRSRKALLERYATVFFNAVRESDQIAKDYAKGSLDGRYNQNIYRARGTPRPRINAHIGRL